MSFNVSLNFGWFAQSLPKEAPISAITGSPQSYYIEVTVYPQWYKQVTVEWKVPTGFGPCVFNVYFSQSADGEWERLNTQPLTDTYLTDPTTREYSKYHSGYYIVEAVMTGNGNATLRSAPSTWKNRRRAWVDLRATEIQRREYWLLSHFTGIKSFLFKKRIYGARCSRCWNYQAEKVVDDNCPVCFGTSFEKGYSDPIPLYVQYDSTPNDRQQTYIGNIEPNQIGAWTISIPEICDEDVIVRVGDWDLYKVLKVVPTELQGNTVRQQLALTQLGKRNIEYQLLDRSVTGLGAKELEEFRGRFTTERLPQQYLNSPVPTSPKWYKENDPDNLPAKYRI